MIVPTKKAWLKIITVFPKKITCQEKCQQVLYWRTCKKLVSQLSIWNSLTLKLWETQVEYLMSRAAPKSLLQNTVVSVYISVWRDTSNNSVNSLRALAFWITASISRSPLGREYILEQLRFALSVDISVKLERRQD